MVCKSKDHAEGSTDCEAFVDNTDKVYSVFHAKEPLSTFHMDDFKVYGVSFSSVEQALQYTRAVRCGQLDVATAIKETKNPYETKEICKQIQFNEDWESQKAKVMKEILTSKINQCISFKEALLNSGSKILVFPKVGDHFWGTGLNLDLSAHTKIGSWPGSNQYGSILMALREQMPSEMGPSDTDFADTGFKMPKTKKGTKDKDTGPTTRSSSSKSPGRIQQFFNTKTSKK